MTHLPLKKPWKKLLYQRQPYPDNFTDESFLDQLKRNTTVFRYSFWKLAEDFSLIAFYMSNMMMVYIAFACIHYEKWDPLAPTAVLSIFTLLGFFVWDRTRSKPLKTASSPYTYTQSPKLKSFLLIIFILLVLTPVLKSLTRSTASDSIWALSFGVCLWNVFFHDYAIDPSISNYRPVVSTNLSLANGIVLASRLGSTLQVFCFLLIAIQVSILLPLFDFSLRKHYSQWHHVLLMVVVTGVEFAVMGRIWGLPTLALWVCVQAVVVFGLPIYLLSLQRYKNELQGPWDHAKPIVNRP